MTLTPQQVEARRSGIGGSDAGVIAGLNRWMTPVQLWQEKTGRVPRPDLSDVEVIEWGHAFEEIIGKMWAKRQGKKIRRVNHTLRSSVHDFMVGHIDFDVVGSPEGLECKNAAAWLADEWGQEQSDEVPLYYLIQGVHYMHVWDAQAWNFAVLIGGNELRSYRVTRDLDAERQLIDLEKRFWTCVVEDTPPPPIKVEDLVRLHPNCTGAIEANAEVIAAVQEYKQIKVEQKAQDKRLDELKLAIGTYMGDRSDLVDPGDHAIAIATYRAHMETRVDSKRFKAELQGDLAMWFNALLDESYPDAAIMRADFAELGAAGVAERLVRSYLKTAPVRKFLPK